MSTTLNTKLFLFLVLLLGGSVFSMSAQAQHGQHGHQFNDSHYRHQPKYHHSHHYHRPQYHHGYRHHHYQPSRGHVVYALPPRHQVIMHGGKRYFHASGVWYEPQGVKFIVALPPINIAAIFD